MIVKSPTLILGIEGGGTKSSWALLDDKLKVVQGGQADSANFYYFGEDGLRKLLQNIRKQLHGEPSAIGLCMAGLHVSSQKELAERLLKEVWPDAEKVIAAEDSKSGHYAAHGSKDGVLVIAGTGSNVVAKKGEVYEKAGGWDYLLGDKGSAYDVGHRALRAAYTAYDATKKTTPLAQAVLRFAGANNMIDLIPIIQDNNSKKYIASFAQVVFEEAAKGNLEAKKILQEAATTLAENVANISKRMKFRSPSVGLVGGMFEKNPYYFKIFCAAVKKLITPEKIFISTVPGAVGAALYILNVSDSSLCRKLESSAAAAVDIEKLPTENRNPRSSNLHKLSVDQLVDLFISEEKFVHKALLKEKAHISKACALVAHCIQKGGRLFYVGAGTSGRLGILDASEMPPTFSVSHDLFQAIMAGGAPAVFRSQEGAEDNADAGAEAIRERGVTKKDVVWGITASGRTPFVMGALEAAEGLGASTVLLTCNPDCKLVKLRPNVTLHLNVGPELITGSTRLKAGTVTKLVLNMASSIAMIRTGKVYENLMTHLNPSNDKLRARAQRLVSQLTGCTSDQALQALQRHQWKVPIAAKGLKSKR